MERLLFVRQPDIGIKGLDPRQLLQALKEVYGTTRASAGWREAFTEEVVKHGYIQHSLDPCHTIYHLLDYDSRIYQRS